MVWLHIEMSSGELRFHSWPYIDRGIEVSLTQEFWLDKMYKVMESQALRFREMSQEQQYCSLSFPVSSSSTEAQVATSINPLEIT